MVMILVVDDSAIDRRLAGGLLEKHEGWEVGYAKDGQEALTWLESPKSNQLIPDVIVTDLQMPLMNGLELVQAVHRDFPLIPVILMTAQGSEAIAVEALEQGAASYVPKKQLADMLAETVERVLSLSGERKSQKTLLSSMRRYECDFVLGSEPILMSSLVAHLQQVVHDMRLFNESERLRIGVALEEALLNAAYHGNLEVSSDLRETDHTAYYQLARQRNTEKPYKDRSIYVSVQLSSEGATYNIRDEGPGFDPSSLPDPTDPANLERPSGRGLLLMRTFMDEIIYNSTGNQVTLKKYLLP